jgi:hypothetical protein
MTRYAHALFIALAVVALASVVSAQPDKLGKVDTVIAEIGKIDVDHWTITLSLVNDESVVGFSVPLRMTAGLNRIVADSAVFAGGRVANFAQNFFRADTAIQCVLVAGVANLVGPKKRLAPGSGRIATIYVSSLEKKPMEKLDVDTTTVNPNNSLQLMADSIQGAPPDTTKVPQADRLFVPAFVVRKAK